VLKDDCGTLYNCEQEGIENIVQLTECTRLCSGGEIIVERGSRCDGALCDESRAVLSCMLVLEETVPMLGGGCQPNANGTIRQTHNRSTSSHRGIGELVVHHHVKSVSLIECNEGSNGSALLAWLDCKDCLARDTIRGDLLVNEVDSGCQGEAGCQKSEERKAKRHV
jgi:hypothetical protein